MAMGIAPVEHALCAQVRGQSWLCHRGSFQGSALSTTPFDEADLVLKDLGVDLWVDGIDRPRKRVRPHLHLGVLAEEIRKQAEAFDQLVARAHWKAEEIRAGDGPIDESLALAGYESDPFNWTGGTRSGIGFLWSYPGADGPQRQVTYTRLSDLLATPHRRATFPYIPRAESDENMWERFKELAENEVTLRREHCVYLGIKIQRDRYEEDPSKWPRSSGKTKATVYYE